MKRMIKQATDWEETLAKDISDRGFGRNEHRIPKTQQQVNPFKNEPKTLTPHQRRYTDCK